MVYSYSEKPSYSYKCSTRGFENIIDFLNNFFCTMNQQMHD